MSQTAIEREQPEYRPSPLSLVPEPPREEEPRTSSQPRRRGLLSRVLWAGVGLGIAISGWALVMTAILAFIGLPVFFFGLALMQSQGD